MVISPAYVVPSGHGGGEAGSGDAAGLLAQAAAGPGFWEDLLGELRRAGLVAELLADGVITAAVAQAGHGHQAGPGADRRGDRDVRHRGGVVP